ncbi:hypothetical protein [Alicyclobacillus sp. SO9]|uniref:hypothetical protein n=1 Tax=Alicyclobacillus sp. SO9 TaxID=2665646 RepID=UPI0018E83B8C|nr:hypothetical protein [Alicyclobacillus sp. SO9]QQE79581.1 hypothetical protein GI364_03540 [Alicyclobacillus sp. SO9]
MRRKTTWLQFRSKSKRRSLRKQLQDISFWNVSDDPAEIPSELQESLALIQDEWAKCADVQYQHLHVQGVPVCLVFISNLIDQETAQRTLMEPLTRYEQGKVTYLH